MRPARALALFLALWLPSVVAIDAEEMLRDPSLEARAQALSKRLRCMVCQNQSIFDSNADLARDLRMVVRQRLQAGDEDEQVLEFVHARYGDFVLLEPPFEAHTAVLWGAPVLFLLLALGVAWRYLRGRAPVDEEVTG